MTTVNEIRTVQAEPLTVEAFAPFGVVLSPQGRTRLPINTYGDRLDIYREPFESDQPIEWFIVQFWKRDLRALFLERHQEITQTFLPLDGKAFVMVVARPNAPEADGLPAMQEMRAFVVPGDVAIQLHRGTWHENPIPLHDGQVIIVSSHASLTRGHQSASAQKSLEAYKQDVEKRNVTDIGGFVLNVALP
jgi:ureidoglycolate lyase